MRNGMPYVGQTVGTLRWRIKCHLQNTDQYFDRIFRKYREHFVFYEIDYGETIDELNKKEVYWIKAHKSMSPDGYNISPGGRNAHGWTYSLAAKLKMRGNPQPGELNPMAKLSNEDVVQMRFLRSAGHSYRELADRFNIAENTAREICTHQSWPHASGPREIQPRSRSVSAGDVQRIRLTLGDSLGEFASRLGVNKSAVCRWENGTRKCCGQNAAAVMALDTRQPIDAAALEALRFKG